MQFGGDKCGQTLLERVSRFIVGCEFELEFIHVDGNQPLVRSSIQRVVNSVSSEPANDRRVEFGSRIRGGPFAEA